LKFLAGMMIAGLVTIAGVMVHYGVLLERTREMEGLRQENHLLREKVSQIEELSYNLKEYEKYVERINTILGVDSGQGGSKEDLVERGYQPTVQVGDNEVVTANEGQQLRSRSFGNEVPSEWPLTRRGFITRRYAEESTFHPGVDIAVPENTPVRTTASGVVAEVGWDNDYGNYVEVKHGKDFATIYGHNSRLIVSKGQWVRKGEIIAFSGSTGRSTAPHLHYEVRRRGVAVDPQPFLLGYRRANGVDGG